MNNFKSQCGEDRWLSDNWHKLGLPEHGFFVEFGAADGIASSNTYWLEKTKGWRGLLCEPDPRHEIKDRPNSIIERCAIGTLGSISLGLTDDPCLSGELRGTHEDGNQPIQSRLEVDSIPLDGLLRTHCIERVDLISIDTEGTELDCWDTLDLTEWRPRVAIIEYLSWGISDDIGKLKAAMLADGYALAHQTKYNGIFVDVR